MLVWGWSIDGSTQWSPEMSLLCCCTSSHHLLKRSRSTHYSPAGHAAAGQTANPTQTAPNPPARGAGGTSSPVCLGTTELSYKIILAEGTFCFK